MKHGTNALGNIRLGSSQVARLKHGTSLAWEHGNVYAQSLQSALPIPHSPYPPPTEEVPKRDDMGVVLAFYSPAGYELPRKHFRETVRQLSGAMIPTAVVQVVRTGQEPEPVPEGVASAVLVSDDALFFKENCWNIGANLLPYSKLLFMDSDISFSPSGWYDIASAELDHFDIIQPYDWCQWEDETGLMAHGKFPAAVPLSQGQAPRLDRYHPGFAWAMTRRTLERLGGFYDRDIVGGGDVAMAYALHPCDTWVVEQSHKNSGASVALKTASYMRYRENALSLNLSVSFSPNVVANHRWHGRFQDRQYHSRGDYLPPLVDGEYPLVRRDDGLLAWENKADSDRLQRYFDSRKEDG